MVELVRNGTSIKLQEPSEAEQLTNLSKSNPQVTLTNSNTTAPTQDGGRCGDTVVDTSPTSRTRRCLPSRIDKIRKVNKSLLKTDTMEEIQPNYGELFTLMKWAQMPSERRVK
jgi:hypothetical protein